MLAEFGLIVNFLAKLIGLLTGPCSKMFCNCSYYRILIEIICSVAQNYVNRFHFNSSVYSYNAWRLSKCGIKEVPFFPTVINNTVINSSVQFLVVRPLFSVETWATGKICGEIHPYPHRSSKKLLDFQVNTWLLWICNLEPMRLIWK